MNIKLIGLIGLMGLIGSISSVWAQDSSRLTLQVDNLHFFVDNEYAASRVDGYTLPGFVMRPRIVWQMEPRVKVEGGVHWLHYWGAHTYPANRSLGAWNAASDTSTRAHVLPWLQARVDFTPWLSLVMGSLDNNQCHHLPLPLYNPELQYAADPEAGVQLLVDHTAVQADVWVDWREFIWNHSPTQEQITAGLSARGRLHNDSGWELYLPVHIVAQHTGGEAVVDTQAVMHTHMNVAGGVGAEYHGGKLRIAAEVYGAGYLNPDGEEWSVVRDSLGWWNEKPRDFRFGWGVFPTVKMSYGGFSLDASYWVGEKFVPILGCYHFSNRSSNTSDMVHNRIRVLSLRGRYAWRQFRQCTLALEGSYYHYFPFTADRTNYLKVNSVASDLFSFGLFLHLHPTFSLQR